MRNVCGAIFIVIYLSSVLYCHVGNSLGGLFAQIPYFIWSKSAIMENAKIPKILVYINLKPYHGIDIYLLNLKVDLATMPILLRRGGGVDPFHYLFIFLFYSLSFYNMGLLIILSTGIMYKFIV